MTESSRKKRVKLMLLQDRFHEFVNFILQTVLSRNCIARLLF
jgi:hypothetical protein